MRYGGDAFSGVRHCLKSRWDRPCSHARELVGAGNNRYRGRCFINNTTSRLSRLCHGHCIESAPLIKTLIPLGQKTMSQRNGLRALFLVVCAA